MEQTLPRKNTVCNHCSYETNIENKLLMYVKHHMHEANFKIPCMICPQKLKSFRTYKKHKKNKHKKSSLPRQNTPQQTKKQLSKPKLTKPKVYWQCQSCDHKILITGI